MEKIKYNHGFILWITLVSAMGGLLFGYDYVVIGGAKPFYERFFDITGSPYLQGWAMSSALVGCLAGALLSGYLSDRFGRKVPLITAASLFTIAAIGTGAVNQLTPFIFYRLVGGIGIGLASAISPMYIAEISPASLRGRLVSINQLTIVIGILSAQVANYLIADKIPDGATDNYILHSWNTQQGWRWMFWTGTFPAVVFLILSFMIPESPRYLAKAGKWAKAGAILSRIGGPGYASRAQKEIAETLQGSHTRLDWKLLSSKNLSPVIILGIVLAVFQQWCGINVIFNYAEEIFTKAGYSVGDMLFNIVITGTVNLVFTFVAMRMVDSWGRRKLMLLGAGGLAVIYLMLGTSYYMELKGLAILVLVLLAIATFSMTLAPITWVVLSEIFPNKIRGGAMALATTALWIACFVLTYSFPILNKLLNAHGTFWLYAFICLAGFLYILKKLPETKGKSLEEIEKEIQHERVTLPPLKSIPVKGAVLFVIVIGLAALSCTRHPIQQKANLAGKWQYALDPEDKGMKERWFRKTFQDTLLLPGSLTSNGIGEDITLSTPWTGQIVDSSYFKNPEYARFRETGNIKIPFWLQPVKYYQGAAWYQKEVTIPQNWQNQSIELFLERCHWESRLWVDGKEAGMQNSLGTPHRYNLTKLLTPGKHVLTLCIDNRIKNIDPGINSHSVSDHTQSNWNGLVGKLTLEARPLVNIHNIQVYPDIQNKKIALKVKVQNPAEKQTSAILQLSVAETSSQISKEVELQAGENTIEMDFTLGDEVKLWNEFHPNVYTLQASLTDKASGQADHLTTTFGMREFKAVGKQLLVNGQPTFLRGTLECAIFPKTGYPSTDVNEWKQIFAICRAHGLNHMRFHSWCPPEAAFDAADQSGFYLQVECSSWANQSTTIGDGKPFDQYLYQESERMVETYGNHPSFCMMVYGNEPGGVNSTSFLTEFVRYWKNKDMRRIYTSGAGWPVIPENDYLSTPDPRIQGWGQELNSVINAQAPRTDYDWSAFNQKYPQPVVSHEIGQWCVYPDFKEIKKYDGVLRARNFELFEQTLKEHGMEQLADSFLLASGKLQALCYKADIEAALRTKDFGGFQLLDLHDFPGQGTALVGVLNPFWEEKGYISAAEYKRFCNSTVPLARMEKCVFTSGETFEASVEVAHYGDGPLTKCTPEWQITDQKGSVIQSGKFKSTDIPLGNGFPLGEISVPLTAFVKAEQLTLEVRLDSLSNHWDFWVYPARKEIVAGEENIKVVQTLDAQTTKFLKEGGSVLLNLSKGSLPQAMGGNIKIGFSSIFWNTAWTRGQAPHTLGILCNPSHPALTEFPTQFHSNYQWWDAMSHSGAIDLTSFPKGLKPIVRVIDDWFTNRPLALLFEAKVGKGKILVSGIDLSSEINLRPEARQLLFSLTKYMASGKFNPTVELNTDQLNNLIGK